MKNERYTIEDTEFYGYKIKVDLKNIGDVDFKSLWDKTDKIASTFDLEEDMYFIGYEDYREMTPKNKIFDYYAMIPRKYFDEKPEDMYSITLEKGEYIKFESNFHNHGPKMFQKAYKHLSKNDLSYDNRFDFEIIPRDASPEADIDDINSILYIGLKLK